MHKAKKKPGPLGHKAPPAPTPFDWSDATPAELQASTAALWQRILCGLRRDEAVGHILDRIPQLLRDVPWEDPPTGMGGRLPGVVRCLDHHAVDEAIQRGGIDRNIHEIDDVYARYDELCRTEYDRIKPELKPVFEGMAAEYRLGGGAVRGWFKHTSAAERNTFGWRYYQWLRPYYYVAGLDDIPAEINQVQRKVTFLGKPVEAGAHPQMVLLLADAEKVLERMGRNAVREVSSQIHSIGGFVPRPQNDLSALSNHALGRAIDIDGEQSNSLFAGTEAEVVDELLAYLKVPGRMRQPLLDICAMPDVEVRRIYERMKAMSDAVRDFLRQWLDTWETDRNRVAAGEHNLRDWQRHPKHRPAEEEVQRTRQDVNSAGADLLAQPMLLISRWVAVLGNPEHVAVRKLKTYRELGLMTLPLQLVQAVQEAGRGLAVLGIQERSGLQYQTRKDIMHFEVLRKGGGAKGPRRRLEGKPVRFSKIHF
jgi:hypothetical protein